MKIRLSFLIIALILLSPVRAENFEGYGVGAGDEFSFEIHDYYYFEIIEGVKTELAGANPFNFDNDLFYGASEFSIVLKEIRGSPWGDYIHENGTVFEGRFIYQITALEFDTYVTSMELYRSSLISQHGEEVVNFEIIDTNDRVGVDIEYTYNETHSTLGERRLYHHDNVEWDRSSGVRTKENRKFSQEYTDPETSSDVYYEQLTHYTLITEDESSELNSISYFVLPFLMVIALFKSRIKTTRIN